VASVILFSGRVIGEGFNTVARDSNAAGHAEINALTDALRTLGMETFSSLDRDSLALVSTFEPCPMCRGALHEYRISRVEYLKPKPVLHVLGTDIRLLFFHWSKEFRGPESLQDSLFARHPTFTASR
ncbi:MAG TPA: nucleoside deaminase, partial [Bacteroidota bacterium]